MGTRRLVAARGRALGPSRARAYIYIYMTRRARGPCLPRARVMVWVRSARNPNPLAVTTLSPHPYSHINSVRWGWVFFLMGGKTETRPPESHVFDSQKTPIFTMLGLGSPLPWGPTLASVPRDSPSKKLTAPPWGGPFVFLFNGEGEQPPSPMGGTVAGPFLWSQAACFTGVPTPPVSRQGGSLGPGSRKLFGAGIQGGWDR